MCGIAGLFFGKKAVLDNPPFLESLRSFVVNLHTLCQIRGNDAAGVAFIRQGKGSQVFRLNASAGKLWDRNEMQSALEDQCAPGLQSVLLHARQATRGTPGDNDNTHPLLSDRLVGIHNGTLWGIPQKYPDAIARRVGQTDSEAMLYALEEEWTRNGQISLGKALSNLSWNVDGGLTGVVIDWYQRETIIFRRERELVALLLPEYDILVIASTSEILRTAIEITHGEASVNNAFADYLNSRKNAIMVAPEPRAFSFNLETFTIERFVRKVQNESKVGYRIFDVAEHNLCRSSVGSSGGGTIIAPEEWKRVWEGRN